MNRKKQTLRAVTLWRDALLTKFLVKPLNFAHGGLDVEGLHVLPVLLQQGDEEVHGQVHVLSQLLLSHLHVADGDVEAENLLHLELDGGLEVQGLLLQVVIMGDKSRELASLGEKDTFKKRQLKNISSPY